LWIGERVYEKILGFLLALRYLTGANRCSRKYLLGLSSFLWSCSKEIKIAAPERRKVDYFSFKTTSRKISYKRQLSFEK